MPPAKGLCPSAHPPGRREGDILRRGTKIIGPFPHALRRWEGDLTGAAPKIFPPLHTPYGGVRWTLSCTAPKIFFPCAHPLERCQGDSIRRHAPEDMPLCALTSAVCEGL